MSAFDQDKLVRPFDYCNNVLMIPTNDARFLLQFEMRTISHRNVRTYTHVSYCLSLNINETFKSAVKIRHAKNKGLKVNAWHEQKLAENNWALPRNKSREEVAIDLFCKNISLLSKSLLTKLNEAKNELHTLFITLCNDLHSNFLSWIFKWLVFNFVNKWDQ